MRNHPLFWTVPIQSLVGYYERQYYANQVVCSPCLRMFCCAVTLCQSTRRCMDVSYWTMRKLPSTGFFSCSTNERIRLSLKPWPAQLSAPDIEYKRNETQRSLHASGREACSRLRTTGFASLPVAEHVRHFVSKSSLSSLQSSPHKICLCGGGFPAPSIMFPDPLSRTSPAVYSTMSNPAYYSVCVAMRMSIPPSNSVPLSLSGRHRAPC